MSPQKKGPLFKRIRLAVNKGPYETTISPTIWIPDTKKSGFYMFPAFRLSDYPCIWKWFCFCLLQSTFAEDNSKMEGMKLVDVINTVKPTVLIGLSGCGGIFNGTWLTYFHKYSKWIVVYNCFLLYYPFSFNQWNTPPHFGKPPAVTHVPFFQTACKMTSHQCIFAWPFSAKKQLYTSWTPGWETLFCKVLCHHPPILG